ncbi:Hypothetical protein precursor [Bosea sp. LC85]|uniref:DUF1254 domain-containing protein n=1 Tax=Bosea sp. LC85 TaxID=1502851 RepID=UPI0004E4548E|nr:hypothetical protein [Bosea sp. LC85]KFC73404.1 Hypothetical protein precursor [Bosea sp. LC85]
MTTFESSHGTSGPVIAKSNRTVNWRQRITTAIRRFALATVAGLLLAGIVHIVTVLLIPLLSERDAATAYAALGTGGQAELVTAQRAELPAPRDADPALVTAVCSYDLSAGPMRVVARVGSLPLGLSLHRRGGGVGYAITDRAAIRGILEFVVMTSEQLDERLARDEEGETTRELRVVSDTEQGLIVARVLAKLPSDRSDAEAMAKSVACGLAD